MWLQLWQEDYRAFICYLSLLHSAHAHSTCAFVNYTSALSASNHCWNTLDLCCLLESGCVISVYFFSCLSALVHICKNNKQASLAKTVQARPLRWIDFSHWSWTDSPSIVEKLDPIQRQLKFCYRLRLWKSRLLCLLDRIVSRSDSSSDKWISSGCSHKLAENRSHLSAGTTSVTRALVYFSSSPLRRQWVPSPDLILIWCRMRGMGARTAVDLATSQKNLD